MEIMPISVGGGGGSGLTEPVSVDDNGGSLTIDGTVTADAGVGPWPVTDNGGSLTIDAASLPLPTGAATETTLVANGVILATIAAAQLPDGHNVTIDNGAAGAAVNIQDGGNSITIDGTIAVSSLPSIPAGSNNIGDVDVLTQPARAATTDSITAKLATDALQNGLTALTPKFAAIAVASSGNNTLVNLVSGKKIRVLNLMLIANAATAIYFDDSGGTVIFGGSTNKIELAANQGFVLSFSPLGWMETGASLALRINLSAANKVSGGLTYVEV